jgi:hypothetical protein
MTRRAAKAVGGLSFAPIREQTDSAITQELESVPHIQRTPPAAIS